MSIRLYRASEAGLQPLEAQVGSLDAVSTEIAHGVYAVFRTYEDGRTFRLGRHLKRMRTSAEMLGQPYPLSEGWLRAMLAEAYQRSGFGLVRIKLTVPFDAPQTAVIAVEPFTPPPDHLYAEGVRVGLVQFAREQARAKDSRFIAAREGLRQGISGEVYEIMWHDAQGSILEGSSTNFYAVLGGSLRTAETGMLEGIARSALLDVAPAVLPVLREPVRVEDVPQLDEAMLTSASRGVMPIVQISDSVIGDGKPGPVFKALAQAYDALIRRELEPLAG